MDSGWLLLTITFPFLPPYKCMFVWYDNMRCCFVTRLHCCARYSKKFYLSKNTISSIAKPNLCKLSQRKKRHMRILLFFCLFVYMHKWAYANSIMPKFTYTQCILYECSYLEESTRHTLTDTATPSLFCFHFMFRSCLVFIQHFIYILSSFIFGVR